MRTTIVCIISALLVACTTPQIEIKPAVIPIRADLTTKCPGLPALSNGKTTVNLGELVTYNSTIQQQYIQCATKDDALIDEVNKASK